MSATDAVFTSLFLLTDIRVKLRETAPLHQLSPEEKGEVAEILGKVRRQLDIIEAELI